MLTNNGYVAVTVEHDEVILPPRQVRVQTCVYVYMVPSCLHTSAGKAPTKPQAVKESPNPVYNRVIV